MDDVIILYLFAMIQNAHSTNLLAVESPLSKMRVDTVRFPICIITRRGPCAVFYALMNLTGNQPIHIPLLNCWKKSTECFFFI